MFGGREMMKTDCLIQGRKEGKQRRWSVWWCMFSWLALRLEDC